MNLLPVNAMACKTNGEISVSPGFINKIVWLFVFIMAMSATAEAQQIIDKGRLSGLLYSDFYWIANNHNEDLEGENGFWARRVYLTYDSNVSQDITARLRLEMNSPGDFTSRVKLEPFVKDLYAKWAMNEDHSLIAGISPTPTWGLVEQIWGYRSVEKSPVDLYKLGSSRDFGIALQGRLGADEKLKYHAMVGNGSGTDAETNRWKKYMLSLAWWFSENLVIEAYGDYNRSNETSTRTTLHGFAGYTSESINIGAMYAAQFQIEEITGADDITETLDVASIFANISLNQKWSAILRADRMFAANPQGPTIDYIPFSDQAESTLLLLGLGFRPVPNLHVIPNIESVFYGDIPNGTRPDSDLIFRTTLAITF